MPLGCRRGVLRGAATGWASFPWAGGAQRGLPGGPAAAALWPPSLPTQEQGHIGQGGPGRLLSLCPSAWTDSDPALADRELAQRLQRNQELAEERLEQVISRFAQLQGRSEEGEAEEDHHQQGGRRPRPDGGGACTSPSGAMEGGPASPRESISGAATREVMGQEPWL